jgi:hypothetical protein
VADVIKAIAESYNLKGLMRQPAREKKVRLVVKVFTLIPPCSTPPALPFLQLGDAECVSRTSKTLFFGRTIAESGQGCFPPGAPTTETTETQVPLLLKAVGCMFPVG